MLSTGNGTFYRFLASTQGITTGTGSTSPDSNDHPTMAALATFPLGPAAFQRAKVSRRR